MSNGNVTLAIWLVFLIGAVLVFRWNGGPR